MFRVLRRFRQDRRADVWAFLAVALVFIVLPLASLTIDVVRGMYVRTHLQVAADAACQAAANTLDVPAFQGTGTRRIQTSLASSQASSMFSATLTDAQKVGFSPSLSVNFPSATTVHCRATASISRILPLTPPMNAVVEATSEMRVSTSNP
jgi:Putative Flp pilus-assembly TadE/G-like